MVKVILTANLQSYYPHPRFDMEAVSVLDLLEKMDRVQKNFSSYILEDGQQIRKHVNIFIDGLLLPKNEASKRLKPGQTVHIMQALSGG